MGLGIHTRYTGGHSQAPPVTPRDGRVKSGGFPEEGAFRLAPIGRRDKRTAGLPARAQHTMNTDRSMGGGGGEAGASDKRQERAGVVQEVQAGGKPWWAPGPKPSRYHVPVAQLSRVLFREEACQGGVGKRLGGRCPKGSNCRPNMRAVCWHQQPHDRTSEAAPDTHDLFLGSAD